MRLSRIACGVAPGAAAVFAMALAVAGAGPGAAQAPAGDANPGKELAEKLALHPADAERFVREYLLKNPRITQEIEAAYKLRLRPPVENRTIIKSSAAAFLAGRAPLGNPKGDVTLVEFVDFNCAPCKRALPMLMDLVRSDSSLKIVMVQYPFLGPGSVEAARIAIALQRQETGADKYPALHEKLLGGTGRVDKVRALAVAAELGLDVARLEAEAASTEVEAALEDGKRLMRGLGLRGVPSYVIGDTILGGTLDAATFKAKIGVARQEQLDSLRICDKGAHPDLRIAACTSVLGRGDLDKLFLVKAFIGRCAGYRGKRQHERALLDCNEAIALDPASAPAFAGRSAVHAAERRHDRALADIAEAIRLEPKAAQHYIARGNLHSTAKAYAEAVEDLSTAIDLDAGNLVAYLRRGNALRKLGQHDRAIRDYEEAIRRNPRYVAAHVRRADALRDLREHAAAIKGYDTAIEIEPKAGNNYYLRGRAYAGNGQYDRALADYTEAVKHAPWLVVAYDARALALLELGKAAEGLPDAERAIALRPDLARGYDTRAHLYEALGRKEEAIADFRKALALAPGLERSLAGLGRLGASL